MSKASRSILLDAVNPNRSTPPPQSTAPVVTQPVLNFEHLVLNQRRMAERHDEAYAALESLQQVCNHLQQARSIDPMAACMLYQQIASLRPHVESYTPSRRVGDFEDDGRNATRDTLVEIQAMRDQLSQRLSQPLMPGLESNWVRTEVEGEWTPMHWLPTNDIVAEPSVSTIQNTGSSKVTAGALEAIRDFERQTMHLVDYYSAQAQSLAEACEQSDWMGVIVQEFAERDPSDGWWSRVQDENQVSWMVSENLPGDVRFAFLAAEQLSGLDRLVEQSRITRSSSPFNDRNLRSLTEQQYQEGGQLTNTVLRTLTQKAEEIQQVNQTLANASSQGDGSDEQLVKARRATARMLASIESLALYFRQVSLQFA